jgi:hypothetical protein
MDSNPWLLGSITWRVRSRGVLFNASIPPLLPSGNPESHSLRARIMAKGERREIRPASYAAIKLLL